MNGLDWVLDQASGLLIGTARAQADGAHPPAADAHGAAAESHAGTADAGHEEAAHGAWDNWFLIAALLIVVAIVWKPAGRAIAGLLDGRAARIRQELDDAARLRDEAQAALASFRKRHAEAMAEAEGIIMHAREEAGALRAQAANDLKALLARREATALDRIAQAEAAAAREIRLLASDVAVQAAREVLAVQLPPERAEALVDSAIAGIPGKLH